MKRNQRIYQKNKGFLIYRIEDLVCESSNICYAIYQASFTKYQNSQMSKINPKNICKHRSYTIKELSDILCINQKTCFRWIDNGLKIIPGCKNPILIYGDDFKQFIAKKKLKKKIKLTRYQFYCLTCKRATFAKKGSIKILSNKKIALCRVCSGKISRII